MNKLSENRCPFCEAEIPGGYEALLKHVEPCSFQDVTKKLTASDSPLNLEILKKIQKTMEIVKQYTSASENYKKTMVVCPECLGYGCSPLPRSVCAGCRVRMIPVEFFIESQAPGSVHFPRA